MLKRLRNVDELYPGVYALPLRDESFMCYAPKNGTIACVKTSASKSEINAVCKRLTTSNTGVKSYALVSSPDHFSTLSVIPTANCNFACKYCYSAHGRSSFTLSSRKLDGVLDWFIRPGRNNQNKLLIMISGGGEPLLARNIVEHIFSHGSAYATQRGCDLAFMLVTNASLVDNDVAQMLSHFHCNVCVSYEILPDVQRYWRGSIERTLKGIENLICGGVNISLNSTITADSVKRMEEMVTIVTKEFPSVKSLVFEPIVDRKYFESPEFMESFFDDFLHYFFKAKDYTKEKGLFLSCSLNDRISSTRQRHCPGKFVLTPTGNISSCQCVSSPYESAFEVATYGNVSENGIVEIDQDSFKNIIDAYSLSRQADCQTCFARFICGGGCANRRRAYNKEQFSILCDFTRNFLWKSFMRFCKRTTTYDK